jgi:uncharacterized protein YecE (DUF72 family)
MVASSPQCRIGTSGFHYDHWRRVFYPAALPKRKWFAHYARHFDTLEINNTFYRVPDRATFEAWRDQTPPGFVYALKFSRFATHNKKLLTPEQTLGYFFDRAAPLLDQTGPILVQLPPRWRINAERLDEFLSRAPRSQRWAVEMRDPTWLSSEVYDVLERHSAALCIHDIIPEHAQGDRQMDVPAFPRRDRGVEVRRQLHHLPAAQLGGTSTPMAPEGDRCLHLLQQRSAQPRRPKRSSSAADARSG